MKIIIVSDIHGNWPALRAVFEAEPTFDRILCLGDLVNYGPFPVECVDWAKEIVPVDWLIQGNHDKAVGVDGDPHCSPPYARLAEETQAFTNRLLPQESKDFLARLKPSRAFQLEGAKCLACHASPIDPLYHYLPETAPVSLWESEIIAAHQPDFLFLGHTHLPMKMHLRRTLVVNPGSVGQPKHGDPLAAYAVWENGEVGLRRVGYNVEETIRGFEGRGVEPHVLNSLITVLRTGGELPSEQIHHTEKAHHGKS
jgi:putative phosphoesterase